MPGKAQRFIVVAANNPRGYKPGRYFFVLHTETGRKVSRYLRSAASAYRRSVRYDRRYAIGDRDWPEVDRCDELRTNPDAVPSLYERFFVGHGCYD